MRYLVTFGYWMVAVLLLAAVLVSFGYGFGRSLFLATALLPGMFCARFFLPMALHAPRRMLAVICVVASVVVVEWLAMLLAYIYTMPDPGWNGQFPVLFSNPVFLLVLLAAFAIPGEWLSCYLKQRMTRDKTLSFISDRRKITLSASQIVYVESCDSEVLLHGADGMQYRTKTRISQWEELLDTRFVRIHRAYIVNADCVTGSGPGYVQLGELRLGVSRKYKEAVTARFSGQDDLV